MNQPSSLRPDPSNAGTPEEDNLSGGHATDFFSQNDEIDKVARTLTLHGGGAVAFELALDLVLNEIVEEARSRTGASGAAIALMRDGEMVCRATTGGSAPDLGMRVETESGLSGACLKSGEIQQCSDTESDARVSAAACRELGVRSVLMAPIVEGGCSVGILEVFSARAHAFGTADIEKMRVLAQQIAEKKRAAEHGTFMPADAPDLSLTDIPRSQEDVDQSLPGTDVSPVEEVSEGTRGHDWSALLVFLVIVVAVSLGVIIGWQAGVKWRNGSAQVNPPAAMAPNRSTTAAASAPAEPPVTTTAAAQKTSPKADSTVKPRTSVSNTVESGGLVVTENGKVIYRIEPATPARRVARQAAAEESQNRLIHRVDPEYPQAARDQNIQGTVVLDVQVLSDGRVANVNVVSGDPMLSEAAVAAVKQWRYRPYAISDQLVKSQTRVTIKFTMPQS